MIGIFRASQQTILGKSPQEALVHARSRLFSEIEEVGFSLYSIPGLHSAFDFVLSPADRLTRRLVTASVALKLVIGLHPRKPISRRILRRVHKPTEPSHTLLGRRGSSFWFLPYVEVSET